MATALERIISRSGPFSQNDFQPVEIDQLHEFPMLVIGAGGLGCELLKNLALSGFQSIHVVDMDTIDISNLNRQFLFRQEDVGRPKAEVAAEYIHSLFPSVNVTAHYCRIQEKSEEFYQQFPLIITGLDSLEARRWMNATVYQIAQQSAALEQDGESGDIPFTAAIVDGGTEGLRGQSRLIFYGGSKARDHACLECSLDMYTKPVTYPLCTIANTPRRPEHCIQYASIVQFPKNFPDRTLDTDSAEDMQWVYKSALQRSQEFNIQGVTWSLTLGVVKNIIPAIASTNAIIAASCTVEALKVVTMMAPNLDNYMMYTGDSGIYTYTFRLERNESCGVCGNGRVEISVDLSDTLEDFIDQVRENPKIQATKPSIRTSTGKTLYMQNPAVLEAQTRPNLQVSLRELLDVSKKTNGIMSENEERGVPELVMTDPALPQVALTLVLQCA